MTAPRENEPAGVGGWLLCFLIVQAALCLWTLSTITDALNGFAALTEVSLNGGALYRPLVLLESTSHVVQAIVPLGGFYLVVRKSRWAPRYWIVFLLFMAAFFLLDLAGGYVLAAESSGSAGAPSLSDDQSSSVILTLINTLAMVAWAIAWAIYWGRSVRVRNTFTATT
jgi:hypothetical protein